MNSRTHSWWETTLADFMKDEKKGCDMDGLWIDMNEPSNSIICQIFINCLLIKTVNRQF